MYFHWLWFLKTKFTHCIDVAYCYRRSVVCVSVCMSVCLSVCMSLGHNREPWPVQKRPNRSRCRLGYGHGWAQGTFSGVRIPLGEGTALGDISGPLWIIGNILSKPKLFGRWQQQCVLLTAASCYTVSSNTASLHFIARGPRQVIDMSYQTV